MKLNKNKIENPQTIPMIIAVGSSKKITGARKVKANTNFDKKAEMVESRIDYCEYLFCDSWEMWIPNASEKASAMATVKTPPITVILECVPALSPTISPRVVITPEVKPKLKPVNTGIRIYINIT